ncbi:MAG: leucine-rich repeat domain-containing protein [Lachnoclostridium sp.]
MRRKRRQFIAMVLAVCLLVGMLPVSVRAEGEGSFDAVGGKVTYRVDGDSITITGCEDTVTAIEFSDTIEGMPVKTIEDRAFWGNTSLTSVAFPENLTSLGEEVFYQCGSLENVDFSSCTSLTEIKWGEFLGSRYYIIDPA